MVPSGSCVTIHIELNPEIEAQLVAGAQARGLALEQYAESLLREAMAGHAQADGKLSVAEVHAMLGAIAEGSEKLPRLPTVAFTRESFYENER
jgi:hypothetical protein